MTFDDDHVRAWYAVRDLAALYDAYRATARAQVAAIQQLRRDLHGGRLNVAEPGRANGDLRTREALIWDLDAVYADRRQQLRRRLRELLELPQRT